MPLTTANMLFRLKGANSTYYGAYTPVENGRTGVPCYFNDPAVPTAWTAIEDAPDPMFYVASFQNLGNAAPQGVHCASTDDVLNGSCLEQLETYIENTGGKYFNPGDVPRRVPEQRRTASMRRCSGAQNGCCLRNGAVRVGEIGQLPGLRETPVRSQRRWLALVGSEALLR